MLGINRLSVGRRRVGVGAAVLKAMACLCVAAVAVTALPATAARDTRTISFFNMHTKERLTVTYKENGRYVPQAMARINHILRDWRRNEAIKMSPQLIDLVYDVHDRLGSREPVHVVSAYRSPVTNAALRRRSSGVAKQSQHTLGHAIDLYFPDVSIAKIRETGLVLQRGGVGYYPSSGRPFVHLDVGSVRHWPRMSRQQLARLFPDGNTLHVPADGRPLPRRVPTSNIAVARNDAPARARSQPASAQVARAEAPATPEAPVMASASASAGGNVLNTLFGGDQERAQPAPQAPAAVRAPVAVPQPPMRPAAPADAQPTAVASLQQPEPAQAQALAQAGVPLLNPPLPALRPAAMLASVAQDEAESAAPVPLPEARPILVAALGQEQAADAAGQGGADVVTGSTRPAEQPVQKPATGSMMLAALGPTGLGQAAPTAAPAAALADKGVDIGVETGMRGIWSDGMAYRPPVMRALVSNQRVIGRAFAALSAPDQSDLAPLVRAPGQSLNIAFDNGAGPRLSPDRFTGTVIQPLQLAAAALPVRTAERR